MRVPLWFGFVTWLTLTAIGAARSEEPALTEPVLFHTPAADRILSRLQVFPPNNPWNEDISARPVHPRSGDIVARIGADKPLRTNRDMGFVLVPTHQPPVEVRITGYADESDPGPFPIPANAPIENWPLSGESLEQIQRHGTGDRHLIVVDPARMLLHELYQARLTDAGWEATCTATFDLRSNRLRPDGWTSSDAAGLPIFPAIVRYDELARGEVRHALRFTVRQTRRAYVYPATHYASRLTDEDLPRMGERFRLRADYDLSGFSPHPRAILQALKTYGMFVADNGLEWAMSTAPDPRIEHLDELRRVRGRDFEVIVPTGPDEGPRAAR